MGRGPGDQRLSAPRRKAAHRDRVRCRNLPACSSGVRCPLAARAGTFDRRRSPSRCRGGRLGLGRRESCHGPAGGFSVARPQRRRYRVRRRQRILCGIRCRDRTCRGGADREGARRVARERHPLRPRCGPHRRGHRRSCRPPQPQRRRAAVGDRHHRDPRGRGGPQRRRRRRRDVARDPRRPAATGLAPRPRPARYRL